LRGFSLICTTTVWSGSRTPRLTSRALRRLTLPVARSSRRAQRIARVQRDAWKCSRTLFRPALPDESPSSHGAVGHQHGLPEQPCSAICLGTRHIIVARQSCSPANWATGYQTRPHMASGAGRNFGRSVGLRRARDEAKAIHRSLQNSRCP